ncbi:MAG: GerW family sporulation protein [Clostridiales bacterium]|nr:GerW family sporulation protein [Clostridiales bacterium]MCC8106606.1 GerW family sporulation protein [Clostridiales bacterium]
MADNFQNTVASLFKGMDEFITTKTVVGDPITVGDTIILPLVDVAFGVAASAKAEDKKNSGGGGMGGKISPSAVLVIQNGCTKLVNVRNQDPVTKVLDMVPDIVNKFTGGKEKENPDPDVEEAIHTAAQEDETTF